MYIHFYYYFDLTSYTFVSSINKNMTNCSKLVVLLRLKYCSYGHYVFLIKQSAPVFRFM